MRDVKKFLTKSINPHPGLIVAAGLFAVMLITAIGGIAHYNSEISQKLSRIESQTNQTKKFPAGSQENTKHQNPQSETASANSGGQVSFVRADGSIVYQSPSSETAQPNKSSSDGMATKPAAPQYITVSLSVNRSYAGPVKVRSGSTQCQVLSSALAQNVISDLEMRKNSQIGSYAVYLINGIGDPKDVWWVYTVNGKEVQGCSFVYAKDGDNINWKYLKN